MMVIKNLSSHVNLERGESQHIMVVGLLEGGALEIPIDALTYGNMVNAYEQLVLQLADQMPVMQPQPAPTVEEVRQQVEQHLGHQLAPGPVPQEEADAEAQLRALEQANAGNLSDADALLRSVGFIQDGESAEEFDALALNGTEDDEPDRGEGMFPEVEDEDDGVEAY